MILVRLLSYCAPLALTHIPSGDSHSRPGSAHCTDPRRGWISSSVSRHPVFCAKPHRSSGSPAISSNAAPAHS